MAHRLTTCTFCGVGCGLYLETADNRMLGAYPSMSHPTNGGHICLRGWHVHEVASSPDRLKRPLLRRKGRLEEATLEEALAFIALRLKELRSRHGPDALAFLASPRCSNEEVFLLQKLARSVIGTNNVDHGAGVYSNNSINVLLRMLGVPATTNSVGELARSEVIVVDGVDLARQLPTIGGAVIRAKLNGAKLVVIDPRRHRVAESADHFLQLKAGTEAVLYGAMAKVIVDRGLANRAFIQGRCSGYEAFEATALGYDLLAAAEYCGVPAERIEAAALAYARAGTAAILYSTGIETRETEAVEAPINLALLAGHLGREGAGIYALTEHNNLQGACDMGLLPDRLPGYRPVACAAARAEVERIWGVELPSNPGLAARSVLSDRAGGRVRGVWLCRYDPASTAFFGDAASALRECELVVAQHLFPTESARFAHVLLPTTAFGEERVTFTSTDRRIQLAERVIDPQPGTTTAWQQLARVAQAMGADWNYASAADVMDEIGRVVPFYRGASHANLERDYGRQWPCTLERPLGTRFLFADSAPTRRFQFAPLPREFGSPGGAGRPPQPALAAESQAGPEAPAPQKYPLTLVFGHSLYYWHRNVLIQHSETLKREYRILLLDYPEGFVELNTEDAKQLGLQDGQRIRLRSAAGSAATVARVTSEVRSGMVFVPYFVRQVQQKLRRSAGNGVRSVAVCVEKEVA